MHVGLWWFTATVHRSTSLVVHWDRSLVVHWDCGYRSLVVHWDRSLVVHWDCGSGDSLGQCIGLWWFTGTVHRSLVVHGDSA